MPKNKAIFFDRDGVVNYRPIGEYVLRINEFHFLPDFLQFFPIIKKKGYLAILISNQQGVGKELMTEDELNQITAFMQRELNKLTGYNFDYIYYCTELKTSNSYRRKPNPGMLLEAIEQLNINPEESWMIGDSESDMIAGKRAGVRTILLNPFPPSQSVADRQFITLNDFDEKL